jgi:hypothetical protein
LDSRDSGGANRNIDHGMTNRDSDPAVYKRIRCDLPIASDIFDAKTSVSTEKNIETNVTRHLRSGFDEPRVGEMKWPQMLVNNEILILKL